MRTVAWSWSCSKPEHAAAAHHSLQSALKGLRVGDAYNRHALTLSREERVNTVADYILTSYQPDFAVLEDGRPVGIITRNEVLQALARGAGHLNVATAMRPVELRVDVALPLDEVRQVMAERTVRVAAVFDGVDYRGLVSLEDLAEAYPLAALRRREVTPESSPA